MGRISNENFTRLIDKYQTEQEKLLGQIATFEDALQEVKDSQSNAVQWAELMAGHVGITELTAENLNLLVERIEVSDRTETGDGMQQTVKICYRFGHGKRRFYKLFINLEISVFTIKTIRKDAMVKLFCV